MLIQCTRKLLDQLDILPKKRPEEDKLFSWHANLIKVNRKKTVVLINDENRYVLALYGLKAKNFMKLDELIIEAIKKTFKYEGIKDEIIEQFIDNSNEVIFTKTKDRSSVAKLNTACSSVQVYERLIDEEKIIQEAVSVRASRVLTGFGSKRFVNPNRKLYNDLKYFAGKPIFSCKAVVLKVTLALRNYEVWRRIVIPAHMTFEQLHKILQVVFGWKDYHLHEFYIFSSEKYDNTSHINHSGFHKDGYKPVLVLACNEEAFEFSDEDIPMELETGKKLSEYIPAKIKYNYDFGDNWEHYIEVEKVIDDYDKNYPICFDGDGNAPPEDVGGEGGYEQFLEIMADEEHPEHEEMKEWGKSQGYKDFDIKTINKRLKEYDIGFFSRINY